jgi:hypothetical protein
MARTPLNIPPGLVSDDTTFAAEGAWSDADKVRFWRTKPQVIGGWESFIGAQLTGVCRAILGWTDIAGNLNVGFGTHSNLQVAYGGELSDVTPTGFTAGLVDGIGGAGFGTGAYSTGDFSEPSTGVTYPLTWSLSNYGQTLIANPRGGTIYQWSNDVTAVAVAVANAPAEVMFALVTPQRQLIAFGCNEEVSGTFNPMCIRGSDLEDITNWTTTAADNVFEQILDGGGRIVAARMVGSYVFVWTDNALYQGTFLGSAGQTYRFDCLGEHCGLLGPNAVAIGGQTAVWLSSDMQFRKCTVGGEPSIVASPLQATLAANLTPSQQDKVVASTISQFGEAWFFYPDVRDGTENSRYISAGAVSNSSVAEGYSSLIADAWSRGTLARTAFIDAGPYQYPLGVDPAGNIYLHERGNSADGAAFSWYLESAGQYAGDADQFIQIKGLWPDFQSQMGPISLTIFTRKYPQDIDRQRGPYSLAPGQSKKDFLASGRVVRLHLAGNSAPTFFRLGKLEFDIEPTGQQ